jgi:hypothetical protein
MEKTTCKVCGRKSYTTIGEGICCACALWACEIFNRAKVRLNRRRA